MVIGSAIIELEIPGNGSLKGKRSVVKSVIARLRREYNLAAAEVDDHDQWQRAVLGIVTISNDAAYAHSVLERAVAALEEWRLDCVLASYSIEIF